jgi:hypothetical protein
MSVLVLNDLTPHLPVGTVFDMSGAGSLPPGPHRPYLYDKEVPT